MNNPENKNELRAEQTKIEFVFVWGMIQTTAHYLSVCGVSSLTSLLVPSLSGIFTLLNNPFTVKERQNKSSLKGFRLISLSVFSKW